MKQFLVKTQQELEEYGSFIHKKSLEPKPETDITFGTALVIHGIDITSIPPAIFESLHLKKLSITGTRITALPDLFGKLAETLREFKCSDNSTLTILPDSIGLLKNMSKLDLDINSLTTFPKQVFSCSNLNDLLFSGVSNLSVKKVPEGFSSLRSLNKLMLKKSGLSELPYDMSTLNISELIISENEFVNVPECIPRMPQIAKVDLSTSREKRISLKEQAMMKTLYPSIEWIF